VVAAEIANEMSVRTACTNADIAGSTFLATGMQPATSLSNNRPSSLGLGLSLPSLVRGYSSPFGSGRIDSFAGNDGLNNRENPHIQQSIWKWPFKIVLFIHALECHLLFALAVSFLDNSYYITFEGTTGRERIEAALVLRRG
jgi:hypothetical protein